MNTISKRPLQQSQQQQLRNVRLQDGAAFDSREDVTDDDYDNNKLIKKGFQNCYRFITKRIFIAAVLLFVVMPVLLLFSLKHNTIIISSPTTKVPTLMTTDVELSAYPFIRYDQNSKTIQKTSFPIIDRLEQCQVSYSPSSSLRTKESEWRKPFWVPSYPSSGASNPTHNGDLAKEIITYLTTGKSVSDLQSSKIKPVKNYHMSIRNKLKRCYGISETVACTQGHPLVPIGPEKQTNNFLPYVIVFIRNFITTFPASLMDKNIAYHNAKGQQTQKEWHELRNKYMESTFQSWKSFIDWWRKDARQSNYSVVLYVPYEDIMTTNIQTGTAIIEKLASTIKQYSNFDVTTSLSDYECIWYQTMKQEWIRQQQIMDYIPSYTQKEKQYMIQEVQRYVDEIENDIMKRISMNNDPTATTITTNAADAAATVDISLIEILKRYIKQIQIYTEER